MTISPELLTLADYMAGEFDNREQALADPAWYVHLRMWQRPISLFGEDSLTIFAEQANVLKLDRPYRQRIMRLMTNEESDGSLHIQYYMPKDPSALLGAGCNSALLNTLTEEQLDLLPGCRLAVTQQQVAPNRYRFFGKPSEQACCTFKYLGDTVQVSLGFETTGDEFLSYDKGIDQTNGKATWGAIMGPYRYTKRNQF
jgi:hypothetical protein